LEILPNNYKKKYQKMNFYHMKVNKINKNQKSQDIKIIIIIAINNINSMKIAITRELTPIMNLNKNQMIIYSINNNNNKMRNLEN
jgi:hypothetical protein